MKRDVEQNRLNITKDYLECDRLNMARRLAIKSLKDKLDDQARTMASKEQFFHDRLRALEKQEKHVTKLQDLLQDLDRPVPAKESQSQLMASFDLYSR
mmetsp:Transcript_22322/g.34551  ORF Transcript_22322/g.34551 Transcript_22322/m.34551 type:complete len:98 (+) Transcript_22322:2602-2895(+)